MWTNCVTGCAQIWNAARKSTARQLDLRMGNELRNVLDSAEKEMSKLKDEFTSAEHYLLALAGSNVAGRKVA